MRRRDFLIGLLLAAKSAGTQAQQKPKVYRLAVVDPISPVTDFAEDGELPYYRGFFDRLRQIGFVEGQNLEIYRWREDEYRAAFARMAREGVDRVFVSEQNENWTHRRSIIALAHEFRLPAIYPDRIFVELGGLMSFEPAWTDFGKDCARIVSEILSGANPAHIPISRSTKYELSLNLKTAKELGIEIPPSLLAQADKVIE